MLSKSFVVGINHHLTDAQHRGIFALNDESQFRLMEIAFRRKIASICILNTCNRTEIYGYGNADTAVEVYGDIIQKPLWQEPGLIKLTGKEAIAHIFKVASGLDSQILGDLEILGQFKSAFYKAKRQNALNGYFERLANTAIQAAKEIRSNTNISSGTVSLSYAAVKYIKKKTRNQPVNILVLGTGEFGKRIAVNIHDYLPKAQITISNRTRQKAEEIANIINCKVHPFEKLDEAIGANDIIISSVNYDGNYLINSQNAGTEPKLFIDMSIPFSIDPNLAQQKHTIVTLDDVSKEISQTIENRKEHVPIALQIIEKYVDEFVAWAEIFEKSESLQMWKNMMTGLSNTCPHLSRMSEAQKNRIINKSMADFALYLKQRTNLPKETREIIRHFLTESDKAIACQKASLTNEPIEIHNCSACRSN